MRADAGDAVLDDRYTFRPDAGRGLAVAAAVRAGLADSLAAALGSLAGSGVTPAADLDRRIRSSPVAPVVFGAYTELVEAIFADDIAVAVAIAADLRAPGFGAIEGLRIVTLADADLGLGQAARYRRLLDADPEVGTSLRPLAPAAFAAASARVRDAVALLDAGAPEIAGELRALVQEIVLVDTADGAWFGGATSFQLWGALFLKLEPPATRFEIAEALAHEAAHALLFGFGMGMPLVENPDGERFSSPLRVDSRPMDGVVHATFVIARMHYAAERLLASGLLGPTEADAAEAARERHARHFADGAAVIRDHARWLPAGEAALRSATAYMAAASPSAAAGP